MLERRLVHLRGASRLCWLLTESTALSLTCLSPRVLTETCTGRRGGGGANCSSGGGCGTVFKVTSAGTLPALYSFCAQTDCVDGNGPTGELALAANGDFYGTTVSGGAHSGGT